MTKTATIKAELLAIQARSKDRMLHPSVVVEWAEKHKDTSEIGRQLEWNNRKAAHAYRLWQVRQLIQLHVVSETSEPVFVSLRVDRASMGGYRRIDDVLTNRDLSRMMLEEALADLERLRENYRRVVALTSVWQEVDKVKAKAKPKAKLGRAKSSGEHHASL